MLNSLKQIFCGITGQLSSKRVVTVVAFFLLCAGFLGNLVFHVQMSDFIFHDFTYIVLVGLGVVGTEPAIAAIAARRRESSHVD